MPATTLITTQQFSRLTGLPHCPTVVDVRIEEDHRADPRLILGSLRRDVVAAAVAIFRLKVGMIPTLAACCASGIAFYLAGSIR